MNDSLEKTFVEWHLKLPERILKECDVTEEKSNLRLTEPPKIRAISAAASTSGLATLKWCENNGASIDDLKIRLHYIPSFLSELFDALTYADPTIMSDDRKKYYENSRLRWWLWAHLGNQIWTKETSYRENIIRDDELQNSATQYLKNPWWHNDYLDWVLLDSLVASDLVKFFDVVGQRRLGMAYVLTSGISWKARLLRPIFMIVSFAIGWILPGVLFYKMAEYVPQVALGLSVLYYGFSVYLLIVWLKSYFTHVLKFKKTPFGALAGMLIAKNVVYDRLGGDTIHVPSLRAAMTEATAAHVVWSSPILSLMDEVESRNKTSWLPSNALETADRDIWRIEQSVK